MPIQNPLKCVEPRNQKNTFFFLLSAIILIFILFRFLDNPLRTASAPSGIVSFELAGTPARASQILASWDTRAHLFAAFGLGFDFLFMVVYAAGISLACQMASQRFAGPLSRLGAWFGWGVIVAAVLDAIENVSLWNLLIGNGASFWPPLAAWCAAIKFSLILLGIFYSLMGLFLPGKKTG